MRGLTVLGEVKTDRASLFVKHLPWLVLFPGNRRHESARDQVDNRRMVDITVRMKGDVEVRAILIF